MARAETAVHLLRVPYDRMLAAAMDLARQLATSAAGG
jgi:hypothetical protein